jgi:proline dehydrogenase
VLRRLLLRAADSPRLGRVVRRHGMRLGASRWVAGETLNEVDRVLRRLIAQGLGAATALFDASVTSQAQADDFVREYQAAVRHLSNASLDAYVGIKLSHLGLGFGDPEAAFHNTAAIISDAATSGQFVRIEMEQSRHVDHTLGVYRRLRDTGHTTAALCCRATCDEARPISSSC